MLCTRSVNTEYKNYLFDLSPSHDDLFRKKILQEKMNTLDYLARSKTDVHTKTDKLLTYMF